MFDEQTVRTWLEVIHGQAPGLSHVCSTGDWTGKTFTQVGAAVDYVRHLHQLGREGIYARITTLRAALPAGSRGGAADTRALPALWADVDIAGPGHKHDPEKHSGLALPPDETAARALIATTGLPTPTVWIHSGGGLYPIWLLDTPAELADGDDQGRAQLAALTATWQTIIRAAAARLGWHYGSGVGDLSRVLRIPGTINRKAGLERPCHIADHGGPRHTLADLLDAVRALQPAPEPVPAAPGMSAGTASAQPSGPRGEGDPGVDFNARATWPEILEPAGWREHYQRDGVTHWTRPGKTEGTSATTNALGTDRLHVFTDAAPPLEQGESYHKFAAYALLQHRGDYTAAARELGQRGYGQPIDHGGRQDDLIAGILGPDVAKVRTAEATRDAPPKRPSSGTPSRFFKDSSLLVETLATEILTLHPCALTPEQRVAVFRGGVYHIDPLALTAALTRLLGDRFSPRHESNVGRFIAGRLHEAGRYLPDRAWLPLLNLPNGMLDLLTGELRPHDPEALSSVQLPVEWDPTATCPRYEAWLADVIPDQADDLEETVASMLDPSRTPTRALFAFGPSRSGKSTFLRIAAAIAGTTNTSAVTLHQLADDRFAAANLYGKIFNSAADISAAHIEDMSTFKMLTGEDPITGNRKYGGQFLFTNRALFAFSANTLPTVGESSRAYVERIKPFAFTSSFAGREKPEIEVAMMAELPGILVRWVAAWRRLTGRGRRLETPAGVRAEFEERSDRVRQWVADRCEVTGNLPPVGAVLPPTEMSSRRWLAQQFNAWAREQGAPPMGERKIIDRLTSIDGVVEVRSSFDKSRGLNIRVVIGDDVSDLLGGRSG